MSMTQSEQVLATSVLSATASCTEQPQHTLLIIDDDATLNGLLCSALKNQEYNIVTADCAEAGIRAAAKLHPTIILLDLCLPDLDGITALAEIRKQGYYTNIILTSCLPLNQWESQALLAGADDVLEKPYNLFAIYKALGLPMRHAA
ncbi:MAG TPA: response regulator [Caldilineaceae bacterium]|nr:response regulator [Caldilineaceae bacterium]